MKSQEIAELAAAALAKKKGSDIELLNVRDKTSIADYFVIGSGSSNIQVKALADAVVEQLATVAEQEPRHIEGRAGDRWILLDYGDVIVHVFHREERDRYQLEKLWADDLISNV